MLGGHGGWRGGKEVGEGQRQPTVVTREMQLSWALLWPARPPDPRLSDRGSQVSCKAGSGEGERGTDFPGLGLRAAPLLPFPQMGQAGEGEEKGME